MEKFTVCSWKLKFKVKFNDPSLPNAVNKITCLVNGTKSPSINH